MQQLAFDFQPKPFIPFDRVRQSIIETGLAPNSYILDLNRGLTNDRHCDLPSRMFLFPISYRDGKDSIDGQSRLMMRHERLYEVPCVAPFIDEVREKTGLEVAYEPFDRFGRDAGETARWWHAVDLCTDPHWQALMDSAFLTDEHCLLGAVRFHVEHGTLSVRNARAVLARLAVPEPEDRSAGLILGAGISPGRIDKSIAPNIGPRGAPGAWIAIHGIEDGWFRRRGQFLSVTEETMARRDALRGLTVNGGRTDG